MTRMICVVLCALLTSCEPNVVSDIQRWTIESDIDHYGRYFESRLYLRRGVMNNLGFAPHTSEYQEFIGRIPRKEGFESALVYYEIAVDAGFYFFYWSAVTDGECSAYYTSSDVAYQPLGDCAFPRAIVLQSESTDDRFVADGLFVGLVMSTSGGEVSRRHAINPELEMGFPGADRMAPKIEQVQWE